MMNMEDKIKVLMDAESRRLRWLYRDAIDAVMKDERPAGSLIAKCAGVLVGGALVYAAMVSGVLTPQRPVSQPDSEAKVVVGGLTFLIHNTGTETCVSPYSPGLSDAGIVMKVTLPQKGKIVEYTVCEEQPMR